MSNFWNLFGKGQSKKDRQSSVPSDQSPDTFILEPILTPSGLVDGSDDSSDLALADIDIDDGQLEEIEVPPVEVEDIADTAEVGDVEELEEIPFVEDAETAPEVEDVEVSDNVDAAISDSEFENIEFFSDIEETAEGENGSNFDDLVNSNVVENNETELTTTNIEESPEATVVAEVETADVNNDEIAADLETEIPEVDEVLATENVAEELETEIEELPEATVEKEVG